MEEFEISYEDSLLEEDENEVTNIPIINNNTETESNEEIEIEYSPEDTDDGDLVMTSEDVRQEELLQQEVEQNTTIIESNTETDDEDLENDSSFTGKLASVASDIGEAFTSGEIFRAIPAGAERAINETAQFLSDTANYVEDKFGIGEEGTLTFGQGALDYISKMDYISDEFDTVTGHMASSISQFATGMFLTRGLASAKNASTARKLVNTAMRAAITDAVVFDPHEANISRTMKDNEWSIPVITEFLATDQEDSSFKNRLRNAGEGVIAGGLLDSMYHGVKAVKLHRQARLEISKSPKGEITKATQGKILSNELDEFNNKGSKELTPEDKRRSKQKIEKTKKLDINAARENTAVEIKIQQDAARLMANASNKMRIRMLREFEDEIGQGRGSISTKGKLDYKKAEDAKEGIINKAKENVKGSYKDDLAAQNLEIEQQNKLIVEANKIKATTGAPQDPLIPKLKETEADVDLLGEDTFTPFLNEASFNKVIAVAADLAVANPKLFSTRTKFKEVLDKKTGKMKSVQTKEKQPVIEKILEVAVSKDLKVKAQFEETLNKYGMNQNELILLTVGQGSAMGRSLRQIRTIMDGINPKDLKAHRQAQAALEQEGKFRNFIMRVENVRRGLMVSSIATAARNFQSAGIRAPLEGLGNVMDTALKEATEGTMGGGLKSLVSGTNWSGSFNHMRYIFRNPRATSQMADFVFEQKGMEAFKDKLFGQINEIRRNTGGGTGSAVDKAFTKVEGVVDFLNTPNRVQEFTVRRGIMFGELERLMKRDWGIDLFDTVTDGNIHKMMNNADGFRPKGDNVPSFAELMDQATRRALDVTYAKQPDTKLFQDLTRIITENGLTVIIPFPRFMFNSIELMAQYGAGASIPITKKLSSLMRKNVSPDGVITARDRELISRNVIGMGMAMAAYQWRTSSNASENYKLVDDKGNRTSLDVTPQFPLRQYLFIGESIKRLKEGTFDDWFNAKDFTETFAGTNVRVGTGHAIIDEIADLAVGDDDLLGGERRAKAAGKLVGQYLSSWGVPFAQILDGQRAAGARNMEYRDMAQDPTLNSMDTFVANVKRPFMQRGFGVSAEEESQMPLRESLFQQGPTKERGPMLGRLLFGLNMTETDSFEGRYLSDKGFTDYGLGSKSNIPSVRNFENKMVRQSLPTIIDFAMDLEEDFENKYDMESDLVKETETLKGYIADRVSPYIIDAIKEIKTELKDAKYAKSNSPRYLAAQQEYRTGLSPTQRKRALQEFKSMYNAMPKVSMSEEGIQDLETLILIGKEY